MPMPVVLASFPCGNGQVEVPSGNIVALYVLGSRSSLRHPEAGEAYGEVGLPSGNIVALCVWVQGAACTTPMPLKHPVKLGAQSLWTHRKNVRGVHVWVPGAACATPRPLERSIALMPIMYKHWTQ